MTHKEMIKEIVKNNGACPDLECGDCPISNKCGPCYSDKHILDVAEQWRKDNESNDK